MPTYNHNSQQQDRVIVQEIQLAFSTHVKSKYPYYVGEGGELLPRAWQRHYLVILLVVVLLFCLLSFATPPPTSLHKLLFHTLGSQQGCQNMFHSKWAEATFLFRKSGSEQAPFPPWLWYPCDMCCWAAAHFPWRCYHSRTHLIDWLFLNFLRLLSIGNKEH